MIRTFSPRSKVYFGFGFSIDSLTWTKTVSYTHLTLPTIYSV